MLNLLSIPIRDNNKTVTHLEPEKSASFKIIISGEHELSMEWI